MNFLINFILINSWVETKIKRKQNQNKENILSMIKQIVIPQLVNIKNQ